MIVIVRNSIYDDDGNLDDTTEVTKTAWRVVPSTKSIEFDGRQFFASWELYFRGDPGITEESKIVVNSKEYLIISLHKHHEIDSDKIHHVKVII